MLEFLEIKAEEKAERRERRAALNLGAVEPTGFLDDIPHGFPALMRALKLQQKAAKAGFDWSEAAPILDKIEEEIGELKQAIANGDRENTQEEYGDLLFAMVNLGRHLKLEPESALRGTNEKFRSRFHYIERKLNEQKQTLDAATLDDFLLAAQARPGC
ncbi:MazG family protein [Bacillus sp. VT-16-64]|nr:MazG family protein [Bacillus sp. VT-16-64]